MGNNYSCGNTVMGNWKLTKLLGEGSFGRVFEAERTDFGETYRSAIKIITIPQNESEIKSARSDGMDDQSVTKYFRSITEEMVSEISLMSKLKGQSNVVSYEDHEVIEHEDDLGWDILIRMELLTPLIDYEQSHLMTRRDAVRLGIDLCRALELCRENEIIHRDIKPENIFVSKAGDFKLGDFGIARTAEKTTSGLSKKGTYSYMAPEVYRGLPYGAGVDIYSLGIVLYRLLNDNRTPFLPQYPAPITHEARETALAARMDGTVPAPPKNADDKLAAIILKACAFDPAERYQSAQELRQALQDYLKNDTGELNLPFNSDPENTAVSMDQSDATMDLLGTVPETVLNEPLSAAGAGQVPAKEPPAERGKKKREKKAKKQAPAAEPLAAQSAENGAQKESTGKKPVKRPLRILFIVLGSLAALIVVLMLTQSSHNGKTAAPPFENVQAAAAKNGKVYEAGDISISPDANFPSVVFGHYVVESGIKDLSAYTGNMDYETGTTAYGDTAEMSVLPCQIEAYSGGSLVGQEEDTEQADQILQKVCKEKYGDKADEYYQNIRELMNYNMIDMTMFGRDGTAYQVKAVYTLSGSKLSMSTYDYDQEKHKISNIKPWTDFEFSFNGRNVVLSRDGRKIELVPSCFTAGGICSMDGYVRSPQQAYRDIAEIYYSTSNGSETSRIYFTNGSHAKDPVIKFGDGNTISIGWLNRIESGKNGTKTVYDPTVVTCKYICCSYANGTNFGLILIADGKYYPYQSTGFEYRDNQIGDNLDGVSSKDLSDSEMSTLLSEQASVTAALQKAFADAGLKVDVDENSGVVTANESVLFATDSAELSDTGKSYLDSFMKVYSSVVSNSAYKGYITEILVEGHTDTSGDYDYNKTLSEKRAATVSAYCASLYPDLAGTIVSRGCSSDDPVKDASGNVDMAASRRVVFKYILKTGAEKAS